MHDFGWIKEKEYMNPSTCDDYEMISRKGGDGMKRLSKVEMGSTTEPSVECYLQDIHVLR